MNKFIIIFTILLAVSTIVFSIEDEKIPDDDSIRVIRSPVPDPHHGGRGYGRGWGGNGGYRGSWGGGYGGSWGGGYGGYGGHNRGGYHRGGGHRW